MYNKSECIKFSILIPTKDRFELLKNAVKSVLMQNYENWELIISDNCSKEDINIWVQDLGDERIKYIRQIMPISVTENWNVTNEYAVGDYKIMLGDDDALLPNALQILSQKILKYNYPELIVFHAYIYLQPNVDPVFTGGDLWKSCPLAEYTKEQLLNIEERQQIVSDCCQFKRNFGYNMQHYCYSQNLESAVKKYGNFYEPPYPDYYTASLMLYLSNRVLNITNEITIIGVTPKSYGYYYRNNNEKEGMIFHKEADYREYAPAMIRNKLCSVDEMSTAAMATFALLAQRIDKLKLDVVNYYRTVIENQAKYIGKEQLEDLVYREMLPHVNTEEKESLIKCFENSCIKMNEQSKKDQILGTRKIPYLDVLQIINNIEKVKCEIESDVKVFDINAWIHRIDADDVRSKITGKQVFIWGAYARGKVIRRSLEIQRILIEGYIDSDLQKKEYDSLTVFEPSNILKQKNAVIVLAHINLYKSVMDQLRENAFITNDGYIWYKAENMINSFNYG